MTLGDRLAGVVSPLSVNARVERAQGLLEGVLIESGDSIDASERADDLRAVSERDHGSPLTLQASDGLVSVQSDDEEVTAARSVLQVSDVPYMQEVEAAVREDDARRGL